MPAIAFVNGRKIALTKRNLRQNLLSFLREGLNLTGAKNGCGNGACGVCTVLIDNVAIRSCKKTVADIVGKNILTIEGLTESEDELHPLQQSFIDCGAIQCGFCTPGMILTAHALLLKNSQPTREQIRRALTGNLCRCTGYQQIVDAVEKAANYYK